jgi:hypothetical protein
MELKELVRNNWGNNEFMVLSLNKTIKNRIIQETSFLDKYYSKIPLRNRAYVILNGIHEDTIPKCTCGKPSALDVTYSINGFRTYCGPECSRKNKIIEKEALKKLSDKEWLYDQRIIQQKSIELIGKELGVSHTPVQKWIKEHKLDEMFDARSRNALAASILKCREKLKKIYDSGLTCEEIAEKLSSTKSTVSRWLSYHGIETRPSNSYERKINRVSQQENDLIDFIKTIYDGEIKTSNRSILNGQELDIYIPEKNIAIEYNGLYSHSYKPWETKECSIKGKNYHLNKTIKCQNQEIQLLHIFSDEWGLKREVVKSLIQSKLNCNLKIYARHCSVVEVDVHTKNMFLNRCHMQGEDKSLIKLGLMCDGELVSIMTFCKARFNRNYEWELSRFCTKLGYNIIGGFSKLLTHFRREYSGSIISYADRRYSDGGVYSKNGFQLIHINSPSYYYVDKNYLKRHNRMKFQKKYIGSYDCTEYEKAREMGFNKIFDCGTLAYGLT